MIQLLYRTEDDARVKELRFLWWQTGEEEDMNASDFTSLSTISSGINLVTVGNLQAGSEKLNFKN